MLHQVASIGGVSFVFEPPELQTEEVRSAQAV